MVRKLKTKTNKKTEMVMDTLSKMFGNEIKERNEKIVKEMQEKKEYKELYDLTIGNYEKGLVPTYEELIPYNQNHKDVFNALVLTEGIYFIPTKDSIDFLKEEIKGYENVIEVGSGNGYLCRLLNITGTDSMCQKLPSMIETYTNMGQKPIEYKNKDVLPLKDMEAIKKLKPDCVVASWTTVKKKLNDHRADGFYDGVEDHKYMNFDCVKKYIFIGHSEIHKSKEIMTVDGVNDILTPLMKDDLGFKVSFHGGEKICSRRFGERDNLIVIIEKTNEKGIKIFL